MDQVETFAGKRILLGVSGSIAAYKAVELLRRLRERGAEVRVSMTAHATRFVTPLTFRTLAGQPVLSDEFAEDAASPIGHIDITDGLDAALIAPATANTIAKIAAGIADNALTSAALAMVCPFLIAPAMNDRMYRNPAVQKNIAILRERGIRIVSPAVGALACGAQGEGRLAETDSILRELAALFRPRDLAGRTVLVTAGPTREPIDAVRFLSNPSTGKMGYALAAAAQERGAQVILVSGPTQLAPPRDVEVVSVRSAAEMHDAVLARIPACDALFMAAAVSDFRPLAPVDRKLKKGEAPDVIRLERTGDILRELGARGSAALLVGFAAETDDREQNALRKLREKNLDLIVLNDLRAAGAGFGADTNAVTIFDREDRRIDLPTMPKREIADRVLDAVLPLLERRGSRKLADAP